MKKKELSIAFYPDSHVFQSRASLLDLMCLVVCRVYKGHLQDELVTKTFGKIQEVANLSALSPVFSSCRIYTLSVEIPRYLEILLVKLRTTEDNHLK